MRPPSLIKPRDEFYSGDPAFKPSPVAPELASNADDDAKDVYKAAVAEYVKAVEERERLVNLARETGDWSALRIEGKTPVKFVMRPLKSRQFNRIADMIIAREVGAVTAKEIAFGAALAEVAGIGDAKITYDDHPRLGRIATPDFLDEVWPTGLVVSAVAELGELVLERARDIAPKS